MFDDDRPPGFYTVAADGESPHFVEVFVDGSVQQLSCPSGTVAYQGRDRTVTCAPPAATDPTD